MPNIYDDDFKQAGPPTAGKSEGPNPYEADFADPHSTTYRSLVLNAEGGAHRGLATALGAPVDLAQGALNLAYRGINKVAGSEVIPENKRDLPGGSKSFESVLQTLGGNPQEVPRTPAERVAAAAGEGAGSMAGGMGIVAAGKNVIGAAAPRTFEALEGIFGKPGVPELAATEGAGSASPGLIAAGKRFAVAAIPKTVKAIETPAIGAMAGGGGQAAEEAAPEGYKGAAKIAGSLAGGMAPLAVRAGVGVGKYAVDIGKEVARPFTAAGQEGIAARKVAGAASDLPAVKDALEQGSQEIVPGSRPTTFQQTGDMGLGQLERVNRTANPDDFMAHDASQNTARRAALDATQPLGNPSEVAAHFRTLRNVLDSQTEGAVNHIQAQAARVTEPVTGATGTAENHGETLRAAAQAARDVAKKQERGLWDAVDPEGNMVMPGTPIADTAKSIEGGLSKAAKPLDGEERDIFDVAKDFGPDTPFKDVNALRSRTSTAMRDELSAHGYSPVYHRLVQIRGSIENAIDKAVENRAAQEQQSVAKGEIQPEDALSARLKGWQDEFYAKQSGLDVGGEGTSGGATARAPTPVGVSGTEGEAGVGPGGTPGTPGVSEPVPLDAEASARLKAASAATRYRAATFDNGTVGTVLKKAGNADEYRTLNSAVPAKVFHPGPTGGEDTRAYIKAAGEDKAIPALTDYAASSLRNASIKADGSLDPAKVRGWISKHEPALAELPPEVRDRFSNAANAEDIVGRAVKARQDQLETFDRSNLGKIMGLQNDGDVVRNVGAIFNSKNAAQNMEQLVTAARNSQSATDGLRRAIVDHIHDSFLSNTEAGTSGQNLIKSDAFQTFMRTKADVLGKVFSPKEVANLRAIANDLQRANRTISATKLPGGSNTAQDLTALANASGERSVLGRFMFEAAAAGVGHEAVGNIVGGLGGWLTAKLAGSLRDAGMKNVDDMVKRAMLDPDFARQLLKKVPPHPSRDELAPLIQRAKQLAVISPVVGGNQEQPNGK